MRPTLPGHGYDGPAVVCVEKVWRDGSQFFLKGWAHANKEPLQSLIFMGGPVEVKHFTARPDLLAHYPKIPGGSARAGFIVQLPAQSSPRVTAQLKTKRRTYQPTIDLPVIDLPVSEQSPELPVHGYDQPAVICIENFWRESGRCFVNGWVHAHKDPVTSVTFMSDDGPIPVTRFWPRPDLLAFYPSIPDNAERAGFSALLPLHKSSILVTQVKTDRATHSPVIVLPTRQRSDFVENSMGMISIEEVFKQFRLEVNQKKLELLEIGSRKVGTETKPSRDFFPQAARFVGMDVHPGSTVDIVGDVHQLSQLVGQRAFDAMFSLSVLEHLAMPWLAAAEMNRALRLGGLVFHLTHQTWPMHHSPNDFFRFTDEGLKVLFGPTHGFEVLRAGMNDRVTVYPGIGREVGNLDMPFSESFGGSFILARKVAELDSVSLESGTLLDQARRYPFGG